MMLLLTLASYDGLHELTSDALASGAATVASAGTYGYDQAGRLTSWNNGTTTTGYAYDGAGNRVQVGSAAYAYDALGRDTGLAVTGGVTTMLS